MIYQEKVSFDGKNWYQIEWKNIDFQTFGKIKGLRDCETIEELENLIIKEYPNSDFKYKFIGKKK